MTPGFRRVVRRVLFGAGALLVGIALAALIANQFRVVYVLHGAISGHRRYYFERGVIRCVFTTTTGSIPLVPGTAAPASPNVIPSLTGPRAPSVVSPWRVIWVPRFSRRDAAFGPYEWLPAYTDDGSAKILVLPWAMLLPVGGLLLCAGLWGIRTPRSHCRRCEYDLRGLPAGASVCPECGAKLRVDTSTQPCASSTSAHA